MKVSKNGKAFEITGIEDAAVAAKFLRQNGFKIISELSNEVPFCEEHQIPMELTDYDDGSRYECPECKREDGEVLGLV